PRLFGITHSGKALNGAECCRVHPGLPVGPGPQRPGRRVLDIGIDRDGDPFGLAAGLAKVDIEVERVPGTTLSAGIGPGDEAHPPVAVSFGIVFVELGRASWRG